jgi:hypothetical protein
MFEVRYFFRDREFGRIDYPSQTLHQCKLDTVAISVNRRTWDIWQMIRTSTIATATTRAHSVSLFRTNIRLNDRVSAWKQGHPKNAVWTSLAKNICTTVEAEESDESKHKP